MSLWTVDTDFREESIELSSLGADDVITTWSCYFDNFLYLQLFIGHSHQIWTDAFLEEVTAGPSSDVVSWPWEILISQVVDGLQSLMSASWHSFWREVHWVLLFRLWWCRYHVVTWLWKFSIPAATDEDYSHKIWKAGTLLVEDIIELSSTSTFLFSCRCATVIKFGK